ELHHTGAEVEHRAGDGVARGDRLVVVDDDLQGRGGRGARERGRERPVEPGGPGTSRGGDLARRFARGREQQGCGEKQASPWSSTATLGERTTGIVPPERRQQ